MSTIRWTLALLAGAACAGGLLYAMREPAEHQPPATQDPAAAAWSLLPVAASAAAGIASSATPPPAVPARMAIAASAPHIGSEGYGPHIDRAQASGDAAAAWESVQWLRNCMATEGKRNSFELLRNQGVSPEMMTQLMVEADAEARRCQTVTQQHRAMLPELAARAMRAGVPEAASAYANATFPADLTPVQHQEVVEAMRRDAQAGEVQSLLGALTANEAWGLSDAEKLAYLSAYITLPGHPETQAMAKALMAQGTIHFKTPPTPEQLAAAMPAVLQILERARAGSRP